MLNSFYCSLYKLDTKICSTIIPLANKSRHFVLPCPYVTLHFHSIIEVLFDSEPSNIIQWLALLSRRILLIFWGQLVKGEGHSDLECEKRFLHNIWNIIWPTAFRHCLKIALIEEKIPIVFGVSWPEVKVTVTLNVKTVSSK